MLTILYGQTRIFFSMSRDGLVPRWFSKLERAPHARAHHGDVRRPRGRLAAFIPLSELAELVNIGTLFAFLLVNIGVIVLRRTMPDMERGFRTRWCRSSR